MRKLFLILLLCGELLAQNDMNIIRDPIYYYNSSGDSTWLDLGNPTSLSFDNAYRWRYRTTELMRLGTDGKLGIGSTSPVTQLQINQAAVYTGVSGLRITTTSTGQSTADGFSMFFDGSDNFFLKSHQAGYLSFQTDAAERFQITANGGSVFGAATGGDQGVGTINAKAVYDDGVLLGGSTTSSGVWYDSDNDTLAMRPSGSLGGTVFKYADGATVLFQMDSTGLVGIGTTPLTSPIRHLNLGSFGTIHGGVRVNNATTTRFTDYLSEQITYSQNGTGAGNFLLATSATGAGILFDLGEDANYQGRWTSTGLIINPGTSTSVVPVNDLSILNASPDMVMTDTDINAVFNTEAQAADTAAIHFNANSSLPNIKITNAAGGALRYIGFQAAGFDTGSETNIFWIAAPDTLYVKLSGNAFFVKLSDFGAAH